MKLNGSIDAGAAREVVTLKLNAGETHTSSGQQSVIVVPDCTIHMKIGRIWVLANRRIVALIPRSYIAAKALYLMGS
jgi:hypothetical protein